MNSEITRTLKIMKVINEHLQEPDCHHKIKNIMREAINEDENAGLPAQQTRTAETTKESKLNGVYRENISK